MAATRPACDLTEGKPARRCTNLVRTRLPWYVIYPECSVGAGAWVPPGALPVRAGARPAGTPGSGRGELRTWKIRGENGGHDERNRDTPEQPRGGGRTARSGTAQLAQSPRSGLRVAEGRDREHRHLQRAPAAAAG